ncbi:MAG TPA: ATP-binding protein [Actinomycetota bacterium]|nr:ATP-binding protein [Actinomycetota bacterium]
MARAEDRMARLALAARVFTPNAPIDSYDLFAGRTDEVVEVITAIYQKGQHVILYGERGVGKTSLANVLAEVFSGQGASPLQAVRTNCGTNDDFTSIWDRLLGKLDLADEGEQTFLGRKLTPEAIRLKLETLEPLTLIVIDELDRLEDDEALSLLADTIKALSDHAVAATVMLVGVADSIEDLVGDHLSIERALAQVQMPRMTQRELGDIIDTGLARIGITSEPGQRERIARLSEGLPFYTHSLSLHASLRAIVNDRDAVTEEDVSQALNTTVKKAQHSIRSAYERATQSTRAALFEEVLLACALAPKSPLGFFTASGVRGPLSRLMGKPYDIPAFARHLTEFAELDRGPVLERRGTKRRYFYRFENPLLQPYVILKGLADGKITEPLLEDLQRLAETTPTASPNEPLPPA